MSETEELSSHAEMIDPGCNGAALVAGTRWNSLDGRCGCVTCGGGDGSYSEPARDAEGVGNMQMDGESGGKCVILFDGSDSPGTKDDGGFWHVVGIRGVAWSGRGVSSAEVSSWE